ncbi:MAG TPA: NAD-dependent epimerase/dehydratase family protein [Chitinophagaceae bacterium]|nr:NAD-dependent epimerase/dehydratase family protein [Chitinophagaceae bacterium]
MSKKVLILGGAGFIGFNVAKYLAEKKDYQLTIADNFMKKNRDEEFEALVKKFNIKIIEDDFSYPDAYHKLDNEYDHVYMMAALVGVDNANSKPHEVIRINTSLTLYTLEWIRRSKIGKVVFASTSENYAGTIEAFGYQVPTPEEVPLTIQNIAHPRFTYAVTKILGESGFLNYSKMLGFEATIIRYHNVFGPRMGFNHVIPHLVIRFRNGQDPYLIYGHDQTRDFCYITDAVEGTVLAMETAGTDQQIYHLGTGVEITIEELTRATGELMGFKGSYTNAPTYPGSVSRRSPDIKKSKKELGFTAKTGWKEGLKKTVEWYNDYFDAGKTVPEKITFQ